MSILRADYPFLIKQFTDNLLISLYLECSERKGVVTEQKRNEYLIKLLKKKKIDKDYKPVKKDIISLIENGRKNFSIEDRLLAMKSLVEGYSNSHVSKFYEFLTLLNTKIGIKSVLFKKNQPQTFGHLYIHKENITTAFHFTGDQVEPVGMMVKSSRWKEIFDYLDPSVFSIEVLKSDDNEANLYLHPVEKKNKTLSLKR